MIAKYAIDVLQKIPVFRNFNESECRQLADVAVERTFSPGERILQQGQTSQDLWIVLEGRCQVVRDSKSDGQITLTELEPYQLFGEMSFFSPAPHSATVVAQTPVRLLCISRVAYDDMIVEGIAAAYKLAYNIVEGVASRLRRMDEWIAELASDGEADESNGFQADEAKGPPESLQEWRRFREKMLNGWNL